MAYAEMILPEFDQEVANTRKVLEQVPEDKLDWKARPKSNTIGWNANHLAEIHAWVEGILTQREWEIAPPGGPPYQSPNLRSVREILDLFDRNVAAGRQALQSVTDEAMQQTWSLLYAGKALITLPRSAVIRRFVLNHTVHHRAILCVYLRLNDVEVPGMYQPSGDDAGA
jgi:uncharacterized damage-inducible protein DinB